MKISKYIYISFISLMACMIACNQNEWDDHTKGTTGDSDIAILQKIAENPNLTKFNEALVKTGYNQLLSQSVNYTIFAPTNDAWSAVNFDDTVALKKLVGYHICFGKHISTDQIMKEQIKMINNKFIKYSPSDQSYEDAKITSPDNVCGNGVIHITDKVLNLRKNVFEYITTEQTSLKQVEYILSLNTQIMDTEKSVQTGVNNQGQIVYDTAWININPFLNKYPLDSEDAKATYILLKDDGFDHLKNKFSPYLLQVDNTLTDSVSNLSICSDMVIALDESIDITKLDTVVNVDNVKIPIRGAQVLGTYEASNGRVYILDKSNILLREKIKPIKIEGENYKRSSAAINMYERYSIWASGERDIMVNCRHTQTDTIHVVGSLGQDSTYTASKTFVWDNNGAVANVINFFVEYQAPVNSVDYDLHYVAYNSIEDHYSDPNHIYKLNQKLFISMPGEPQLTKGEGTAANTVKNNYLGDATCFVGQDKAGVHKLTKLNQWSLTGVNQFINKPLDNPDSDLVKVPTSGNMTLWLCNTTVTANASAQGMLFLDYILLVPQLPNE